MYIYNSKELDGVMSKIENGNYKLEYREKKSKETIFLTFKLVKRAE
jgi:predicted RNA-binding protein